jgi:dephospho-CoA kinase
MPAIASRFGARFVKPDGSLDRALMREVVFAEPNAKRQLEEILHPLIGAEVRARIREARAPYLVLVVPLLLETGAYRDLLSRILVVDCAESKQIERAMARSGLSADEVRAIMAAQIPRAERLKRADDVICNDGSIDALGIRVQSLHEQYLAAARTAS